MSSRWSVTDALKKLPKSVFVYSYQRKKARSYAFSVQKKIRESLPENA